MEFRETTRTIISLVEQRTGLPVRVVKDPKLTLLASVRMAGDALPVHTILYNPSLPGHPDYLISFECGFILRLFECPPEQRKRFASSPKGHQRVEELLRKPGGIAEKLGLAGAGLDQLRNQLLDGLMLQLHSMSVGMRVHSWLYASYPALHDLQRVCATKELQDNSKTMDSQIKAWIPEAVYSASIALNAVLADFWSDILGEPRHTVQYKTSKYWTTAMRLKKIYEEVEDDPAKDGQLVDAWADVLGVSGWYQWVPYSLPNKENPS